MEHHTITAHEGHTRVRPDELQRDVLNRLRSAAGHINGIARMVEEDAYCIDVIRQIEAVQAALDKVTLLLLDDHMKSCVTEAIRSGDEGEARRVLAELKEVFAALNRM